MLGEHNAIYCDHCGAFEDFFYTVYVKKDIGNGHIWTSWFEICRDCLKTMNSWMEEKRNGRIERGSNYKNLKRRKFMELLHKAKAENAGYVSPFGISPLASTQNPLKK